MGMNDQDAKAASLPLRVAIILRGESFRAESSADKGDFHQLGHHKRRHCEDNSFDEQQQIATELMRGIRNMENLGFVVDLFGATYPCHNGRDYVSKLQPMYAPNMQELHVLPKTKNSSQLSTMAHAMRMTIESGIQYDGFYLLRWDKRYPFLHQFNAPNCFVEKEPQDCTFFTGWRLCANDLLFYVPGTYAKRLLSFMDLGSRDGGCCQGHCPVDCNFCAENFATSLGFARDTKFLEPWRHMKQYPWVAEPRTPCGGDLSGLSQITSQTVLEYQDFPVDEAEEHDSECVKKLQPTQKK
jgi:hypothetical protein